MAEKRDYYEILQVERTATKAEISSAYRKLALKYHPDRNPGDDEAARRFKEAAEAFEVLNDEEQRAIYDKYGHAGLEGGAGAHHFEDINDIFAAFGHIFGDAGFGDIFGRRGGGRARSRGDDVRCDVSLDLMEAARGTKKQIRFNRHVKCPTCTGSGAKPGTSPETCEYCGGVGQVIQSSGFFRVQRTCPACRGSGKAIKHPCTDCRGSGYVLKEVEQEVSIPAGVDDGTRLVIRGEGDPSPNGGPPGDCYCFISIREHPLFHREGQHLVCEIPITYSQAALGAEIEVPTLDGPEKLTIPAGTQPNQVFRLAGRGMPDPRRSGYGDLHVVAHVDVPKSLTKRQEELLRELAEEEHTNVTAKRKSFFEQLKEFFVPEESSQED